jgi:hypothetical protein
MRVSIEKRGDTITLCYNLQRNPPTYDIVVFLALAEQERIKLGAKYFYVNIDSRITSQYAERMPDWDWRIKHLLIPLCLMMPKCKGVGIGSDGLELGYNFKDILPEYYNLDKFYHITAGPLALKRAESFDHTITIRQSTLNPVRNSNFDGWDNVFNFTTLINDKVLLIPDTEQELTIYNMNVEMRMAAYQNSKMNWFINNGPGCLALLNPTVPYRFLKIHTEAAPSTSMRHLNRIGLVYNESPKICTKNQKYIWLNDTEDNIRTELNTMEGFA